MLCKKEKDGLSYYHLGNPELPKLALFHGFLGQSGDLLDFARDIQDIRSIFVIDLPGAGSSKPLSELSIHSFDQLINFLCAWLIRQSSQSWDLFGYSLGGRISLGLALDTELPVRRLLLESSLPGIEDRKEREQRRELDLQLSEKLRAVPPDEFLTDWYSLPLFRSLAQHPLFPQFLVDRARELRRAEMAELLTLCSPGEIESYWDRLSELHSFGFICGEKDEKYTGIAARLESLHNGVSVAVIQGAGHNTHFEQPVRLLTAARSFFQQDRFV